MDRWHMKVLIQNKNIIDVGQNKNIYGNQIVSRYEGHNFLSHY